MKCKIKMNLNITPFGKINYQTIAPEKSQGEDLIEMPEYIEPITTNTKVSDINFEEKKTYIIPKTTA